jgi:hypothetical protein
VLAAVGPVARFVAHGVIGEYRASTTAFNLVVPGGYYRAPGFELAALPVSYALSVAAWWLFSLVLTLLARRFGGHRDAAGARKAAAYAATPVWLAGAGALFASVPYFDFLEYVALIAGLAYAVFVGTIALPVHMGTPQPKAPGHMLAALGVSALAFAVAYNVLITRLLVAGLR